MVFNLDDTLHHREYAKTPIPCVVPNSSSSSDDPSASNVSSLLVPKSFHPAQPSLPSLFPLTFPALSCLLSRLPYGLLARRGACTCCDHCQGCRRDVPLGSGLQLGMCLLRSSLLEALQPIHHVLKFGVDAMHEVSLVICLHLRIFPPFPPSL